MKRHLAVLYLLAGGAASFSGLEAQRTLSFSGDVEYDPFFSIELVDYQGEEYRLFNVSLIEGLSLPWPDNQGVLKESLDQETKFFFWLRRGGTRGMITYSLPFTKIRQLEFHGSYGKDLPFYTPATLTLTDGNSYEIHVKSDGYLRGIDEDLGTYALIWMAHGGVKKINFLHNGTYQRCPLDGAVFYNQELEVCPFDGTPLVSQRLP